MRRIALTTLLGVVVLVLGALPAAAAVTATIQSPSPGQEIDSSVGTQVRVQRDLLDRDVRRVQLRLVRDGAPTSEADLACVQGCAGGTDQTWSQLTLDPRSPDEFGVSHPLANGGWVVQTRWQDDADVWSTWGGDTGVTVSVPPSPVERLSATADGPDVTLTWTRAPEPDISAYRIQRRPDGGSWAVVDSTSGTASSYDDSDVPSAGTYEYRVVTVRPDGYGSVLTATSAGTSVTTTSSTSDPSPSPDTDDDGTSSGGTSSDDGGSTTGGSTSTDGTGTTDGTDTTDGDGSTSDGDGSTADGSDDGTAAAGDGDEGDGGSTASGGGRARVAPPPGARRSTSFGIDAQLPGPLVAPPSAEEERFYGEGDEFSEELDYGAAQPAAPGELAGEPRSVLQRIPGGVQEFIVSRLETRTLLRSIAAGLLFVALGLHAYRWMHATPNE